MTTLTFVVLALTGGIGAIIGSFVWVAIVSLRRLRGLPAAVSYQEMRWVWGISGFLGVPLIFPWMPSFILDRARALMPWLYMACIFVLTANLSIAAGTIAALTVVALARFLGLVSGTRLDPLRIAWQRALVWGVSAVVGVPLLAGRTSKIIQAVAAW